MATADGKSGGGPGPKDLRLVLAPNPSPMTGPGTNTFIVGQGEVAIIDPGPDDPRHLAAILAALGPGERVGAILVTHAHLDHSALAPALQAATGAPVLAFGGSTSGRSPVMQRLAAGGLVGGGEGVDLGFRPDRCLADGERIDGPGWSLTALHCPGHMGGHLCFALGDVLFSGDHVMGWAPSLVSPPDGDMGAYMASLARLAAAQWTRILPAHGVAIDQPAERLAELTRHRKEREAQILTALAVGPSDLAALTGRVYHDTDARLLAAASRNLLAHLIDLSERNLVTCKPFPGPEARFQLA